MSCCVDSVDQALLNVFSFEIAIISASGKNVEFSCWVIDKFCHCCEISYGVNLLSHFRPSSLPLSTYQPIFHNFLCSLFAFAHSLSKVRALSGSVWSMAFCRAQEGWSPQGKGTLLHPRLLALMTLEDPNRAIYLPPWPHPTTLYLGVQFKLYLVVRTEVYDFGKKFQWNHVVNL